MPARKPKALITRHDTAAEAHARADRETALRPERSLPKAAPAQLNGHPAAQAVWRRLVRMYGELEGEIVTRLDGDLLVDYCLLAEQVLQLDTMRAAAYKAWLQLANRHEELSQDPNMIDEAILLAVKVVGAFDAVVKLDGRADRKRALLLQLRQSLYLTPRARAGVAPAKKDEPEPPDPMDALLGEVSDYVNGGQGDDR